MKKMLISCVLLCLAILLVVAGVGVGKKPIPVKELAKAEVIEYEDESLTSAEPIEIEEDNKTSICVYGNAKISLSPDKAKICAKIETLNSQMADAKQENFDTFEKIIDALVSGGISREAITMDSFNCYPNFDYDMGRKIVGYYSTTRFCVNLESLDKIKECVDILTENGVTNICDISYQVSNMEEEYNNTLASAVENAKAKAEKLLNRTDLKVTSIKEQYVYSCNTLARDYAENLSSSDLVGKIELEAQVLVEFN